MLNVGSIMISLLIMALSVMTVLAVTTLPSNDGPKVTPTYYMGNPPALTSATGYTFKTPSAPVSGVTYSLNVPIDGMNYTFYYEVYGTWGDPSSSGSQYVRFWTEDDYKIVATVVVKGGPDANIYNYDPQTNNDSNLVSPTMSNGQIPGISHLDFRFEKPPLGSLKVTKDIVLGNVVNPDAVIIPTFKIKIMGPSYPDGSAWVDFTTDGQAYTWENLLPGPYTVIEQEAGPLWNESVPAGPHNVTSGNRTDVNVTNTYVPGSLRVTKDIELGNVVNPDAVTIPTFKIRIWGPSYPDGSAWVDFTTDGQYHTWENLIPGDYTVEEEEAGVLWNESVPAGPHAVTAGNRTDVTVTNTYVPGSLRVTKDIVLGNVVNPDAVGPFSFNIKIQGPSYPNGSSWVEFTSDGQQYTWENLIPGDYTVYEEEAGALWNESVPAGPHAVTADNRTDVTVTNTYVPGSLRVTKDIVLGSVDPAMITIPTFKIRIWGPSYPAGSDWVDFTTDGQQYTWNNLIPGDYTVEEMDSGASWLQSVPAGPHAVSPNGITDVTVTNTYVLPGSETAWAFGDYTFKDEGISSQWGWFSRLSPGDERHLELWAGAGQNDLSKGTLVGSVHVHYMMNGTVSVKIELADGVMTTKDAQVYAGTSMPGASPGRYPFRVSANGLEQILMMKKSVATFAGPIYFTLHLDVMILG